MKRIAPLIAFAFVLALAGPAFADYQAGRDAYARGDYDTAFRELLPAAEAGDANAQFLVGSLVQSGQGTTLDLAAAAEWYRKAAEQGHAGAQGALGEMYFVGEGIAQDYDEAVGWFVKAAEQGLTTAQHNLAVMYENGLGTVQDNVKSYMWFRIVSIYEPEGPLQQSAAQNLALLEGVLMPADLSEAQRLAMEWVVLHPDVGPQ
ncbi:MAG TPA: tetratricopeptide repeat protein [Alphaproteobacteria bacterium]|nr:tetratricopeptide repeat protein [Alphaproteobacteria bacterium]